METFASLANHIPAFVAFLIPIGIIIFAIRDEMIANEKLDRDRENGLKQVRLREIARQIEEMERG